MNDELQLIIDAYFEGSASPEMLEELDRALREDEEFRIRFLESASLISDLHEVMCGVGESEIFTVPSVPARRSPNWRPLAMVASVVLGMGALLYALLSPPREPDPSSLVLVEGWAGYGGRELQVGDRCDPPGRIVAGIDAAVVLRYPDGSLLTLEEGSALRLEVGKGKKVFLEHGSLFADMKPQPVGREMVMDTVNSKVTVLGTRYRLATTIIEDLLEVEHGKVRVLEKKTNNEVVATRGASSRVPGVSENLFPSFPEGKAIPDGPGFPVAKYVPERSWFTEDFDLNWTRGLWELSTTKEPEYHPLVKPAPEAFLESSHGWRGHPTNVLNFSTPGDGIPARLRLSEKVGWDYFFLKYYYKPDGDEPFEMNPLCLDLPEGTEIKTIFEGEGPEVLELPEIWNRVFIQYLRFWNGEKWQLEVRRHLNFEHRSTVRIDIERAPAILFDVKSGGCLFEVISVGQLNPPDDPRGNPFERWMCTEDFEPNPHEISWDVSPHDEERFYPVLAPEKGVVLKQAIGRRGKLKNVLALSNPSSDGIPSQIRLRRRIRWDDFVVQYHYRPTSEESLVVDPLCLHLPDGTEREVVDESSVGEFPAESGIWNKVRLEFRRAHDGGRSHFEVKRLVNDEHQSTTRLYIEWIPAIMLDVKSGAGIFDWIDVRKLPPVSGES